METLKGAQLYTANEFLCLCSNYAAQRQIDGEDRQKARGKLCYLGKRLTWKLWDNGHAVHRWNVPRKLSNC